MPAGNRIDYYKYYLEPPNDSLSILVTIYIERGSDDSDGNETYKFDLTFASVENIPSGGQFKGDIKSEYDVSSISTGWAFNQAQITDDEIEPTSGYKKIDIIYDTLRDKALQKIPAYINTLYNFNITTYEFLFSSKANLSDNNLNTTSSTSNNPETSPGSDAPDNIEIEHLSNTPEPNVEPTKQVEESNAETDNAAETASESEFETEELQPDPEVITNNTPPTLEPSTQEKIAKTIKKKDRELKKLLVKTLISTLTSIGAKYIASQIILPDTCAIKPVTDRAIKIRNQVVEKLNSVVKILDTISLVLTGLTLAAALYESTRKKVKTARQAASIAAAAIPPPAGVPGQVVSSLNTLKDVEEETEKNSYKVTAALTTINLYLASLNATLVLIMSLLSQLDQYLDLCAPDAELIPLSPTLLTIQQNNQIQETSLETTYNNFLLEIEEVPFSPTVNRRRAVAKNKDGIILIATPLSFTTLNNVLITELKLLIDSNNLKAD